MKLSDLLNQYNESEWEELLQGYKPYHSGAFMSPNSNSILYKSATSMGPSRPQSLGEVASRFLSTRLGGW